MSEKNGHSGKTDLAAEIRAEIDVTIGEWAAPPPAGSLTKTEKDEIVKTFFEVIKENGFSVALDGFSRWMQKCSRMTFYDALFIFRDIRHVYESLRKSLIEDQGEDAYTGALDVAIHVVSRSAKDHFKFFFENYDLRNARDLAEKARIVRELVEAYAAERWQYDDFVKAAVLELQSETEKTLEIQSYETGLRDLITESKTDFIAEVIPEEKEKRKQRAKGTSLARTGIFFYYLFDYLEIKTKPGERARILSELTGFSNNTLEGVLGNPHKEANDDFQKFSQDMEYVKDIFSNLGLSEAAKAIVNDLADQETETSI
jgi:hypothetical protein